MRAFSFSLGLLIAAMLMAMSLGSLSIELGVVVHAIAAGFTSGEESLQGLARIVWAVRLPRVLMAALVGGALGASGSATQAVFRNPLADPYLLGVASGAGLGAVLGWRLGAEASASFDWIMFDVSSAGSAVPLFAFMGGLGAVGLTILLARPGSGRIESLLLAGVVVSSMLTAVTTYVLLSQEEQIRAVIAWTLGNLALASWEQLSALLPYTALALLVLVVLGPALDALQLGDDTARTLGVRVTAVRWTALAAATLATSAAISFVGVIGFVGLVAPHTVRRLGIARHRQLVVISAVIGAVFLVLGDLAARLVIRPAELPVGIALTLLGGPVFLAILRRSGPLQKH